ncbi:MAG: FtsX-like permease family protein, partial [Bacteroidetes bacterium]|nr:FtsX-like permease family protein [Bacteroidota bacterium]
KFALRINPYNLQQTIAEVEKKYHALIPDNPFQYAFREDINHSAYNKENRWKNIITYSACLAIFISCIGLFGISILVTKKREKEIAIRKVLGASTIKLLLLLSGDFIKFVLISFLIASPLGLFAIKKWLQDFAYRADISWQIFLGTGALVIFISLLTTISHSVKASLANPVISLKQE